MTGARPQFNMARLRRFARLRRIEKKFPRLTKAQARALCEAAVQCHPITVLPPGPQFTQYWRKPHNTFTRTF